MPYDITDAKDDIQVCWARLMQLEEELVKRKIIAPRKKPEEQEK